MEWVTVVEVATFLLALVGGVLSVPIVDWLKEAAGIDGRLAQVLTVAVSVIMAILTLTVGGVLSPDSVTPENVGSVLLAVLLASQAEYNRLRQKIDAPDV